MSTTWRKRCGKFPEPASRTCDNGKEEIGELYCVEKTVQLGALRATYEYNIYHWLESDEWKADVISPHGWHDLDDAELKYVLHETRITEQ